MVGSCGRSYSLVMKKLFPTPFPLTSSLQRLKSQTFAFCSFCLAKDDDMMAQGPEDQQNSAGHF